MDETINTTITEEIEYGNGDKCTKIIKDGNVISKEITCVNGLYSTNSTTEYEYDDKNRILKETIYHNEHTITNNGMDNFTSIKYTSEYTYPSNFTTVICKYINDELDSITSVTDGVLDEMFGRLKREVISYPNSTLKNKVIETRKLYTNIDTDNLATEIISVDGEIKSHTQYFYKKFGISEVIETSGNCITSTRYLPSGKICLISKQDLKTNELTMHEYTYDNSRISRIKNYINNKLIDTDTYTYSED